MKRGNEKQKRKRVIVDSRGLKSNKARMNGQAVKKMHKPVADVALNY